MKHYFGHTKKIVSLLSIAAVFLIYQNCSNAQFSMGNVVIDESGDLRNVEILPDIEVDPDDMRLIELKEDDKDEVVGPLGENCKGNLVSNGSFESVDKRRGTIKGKSLVFLSSIRNWDVYDNLPSSKEGELNGWEVVSGAGVEVQSNHFVTRSPSGRMVIELDSHGPNSNSSMSQMVSFCEGIYEFSFLYYARTKKKDDNVIEAQIEGIYLSEVNLKKSGDWIKVTQRIKVNRADDYELNFTARGDATSYGALIDNVIIKKIN